MDEYYDPKKEYIKRLERIASRGGGEWDAYDNEVDRKWIEEYKEVIASFKKALQSELKKCDVMNCYLSGADKDKIIDGSKIMALAFFITLEFFLIYGISIY